MPFRNKLINLKGSMSRNLKQFPYFSFCVSYEPQSNVKDEELDQVSALSLKELRIIAKEKWCRATEEKLQILGAKYKENQCFLYNLYSVYEEYDEYEKAYKTALELYKNFPRFIYGLFALCFSAINLELQDKIPDIIGTEMKLNSLYADRDVFSSVEVLTFYYIVFEYYRYLNDFEKMKEISELMADVDPNNTFTKHVKTIFMQFDAE